MCTEEFIWYQSPEIWAAVIAAASAIITMVFSVAFLHRKNKILTGFQKEVKDHEAELQRKLEILKVRYGALHSNRLEVISEIHKMLLVVRRDAKNYKSLEDLIQKYGKNNEQYDTQTFDCYKNLIDGLDNFNERQSLFITYLEENSIYLSPQLYTNIRTLNNIMIMSIGKSAIKTVDHNVISGYKENMLSGLLETFDSAETLKIINVIIEELRTKFRDLIGVDKDE